MFLLIRLRTTVRMRARTKAPAATDQGTMKLPERSRIVEVRIGPTAAPKPAKVVIKPTILL